MTKIMASGTTVWVQLKFHLDVMTACASQNIGVVMEEYLIVMAGKMNQHVENKAKKNRWRKNKWRRNKWRRNKWRRNKWKGMDNQMEDVLLG